MENIKFRKAEINDFEEVLRLNLALFSNEINNQYDETLDMNWTFGDVAKEYFKARIEKEDGFVGLVENEGKIVGYLCGGMVEKPLWRKMGQLAELENMYIEEKCRGIGAGSILIQEFLSWCKANGAERVCVKASAPNSKAIEFYRYNGFKDYEVNLELKIK